MHKIVIIGSGNLATHLSLALFKIGHQITQVYSRQIDNAQALALKFNCKAISNLNDLDEHADLYIIAVSDCAISKIIEKVNFASKKVVHTAGSESLSVFKGNIENYGVFYPLQTFSKIREINFSNVPICIEANNEEFKLFLNKLAKQISNNIWNIDSETRKILHLSGILVNNFVNHLYFLAEDILKEKDIPFKILQELIKETEAKATDIGPEHAQTGPAKRNDLETQKKHLDLLSSKPNLKQIYELISKDIFLKYN